MNDKLIDYKCLYEEQKRISDEYRKLVNDYYERNKDAEESRMKWIKCSDQPAPKDRKFLFSYYYGVGIGRHGQCFTTIIGNSERTDRKSVV